MLGFFCFGYKCVWWSGKQEFWSSDILLYFSKRTTKKNLNIFFVCFVINRALSLNIYLDFLTHNICWLIWIWFLFHFSILFDHLKKKKQTNNIIVYSQYYPTTHIDYCSPPCAVWLRFETNGNNSTKTLTTLNVRNNINIQNYTHIHTCQRNIHNANANYQIVTSFLPFQRRHTHTHTPHTTHSIKHA